MNEIFASIERPDPALVERYRSVLLGQLVKVLSPGQIMDDAIKPFAGRKVRIAGPAVTAVSSHPDFMLGILATGVARAGDVIVIAPGDPDAGAAWGAGLTISTDILKCEGRSGGRLRHRRGSHAGLHHAGVLSRRHVAHPAQY